MLASGHHSPNGNKVADTAKDNTRMEDFMVPEGLGPRVRPPAGVDHCTEGVGHTTREQQQDDLGAKALPPWLHQGYGHPAHGHVDRGLEQAAYVGKEHRAENAQGGDAPHQWEGEAEVIVVRGEEKGRVGPTDENKDHRVVDHTQGPPGSFGPCGRVVGAADSQEQHQRCGVGEGACGHGSRHGLLNQYPASRHCDYR